MLLAGQTAIVTGGGQGIGRGIALKLALLGADVALFEVNAKTAEATASEIRTLGRAALAFPVDVTDFDRVSAATRAAVEKLGRLDILVNNVGWTRNEPFTLNQPETWQKVVALNFLSVLNCTRAALAHMTPSGGGRIISIASDAARVGTPREAVYAGAKAAVIGFSKSLAVEVAGRKITVNVVSPSTTDTPLIREILTPEQIARREKANPLGRLGAPEDIANAVAFFALPESGYITGQVLSVNGGSSRLG